MTLFKLLYMGSLPYIANYTAYKISIQWCLHLLTRKSQLTNIGRFIKDDIFFTF